MQRWWRCKSPVEYIKINYTVSGGNYFRKNDGSPGDDVGPIYGSGSLTDCARARMARGEVTRGRDSEVLNKITKNRKIY